MKMSKNKKTLFKESILENKKLMIRNIGKILKEERIKKGITRKQLSDSTNISENYIGYIEQGKYGISLLKFILITNEIGLNPNFVINRAIEMGNRREKIYKKRDVEEKDIIKEILMYLKQ